MITITCQEEVHVGNNMQQKRGGTPAQKPLCEDLGLCRRWDDSEFGHSKGSHLGESKGLAGWRGREKAQNGGWRRGVPELMQNKTEPDGQHVQEPELDLRGAEAQGSKEWQGEYPTRQRALFTTTWYAKPKLEQRHVKRDSRSYLQSLVHHSCARMGKMKFWKDDCWLEEGDWISNF